MVIFRCTFLFFNVRISTKKTRFFFSLACSDHVNNITLCKRVVKLIYPEVVSTSSVSCNILYDDKDERACVCNIVRYFISELLYDEVVSTSIVNFIAHKYVKCVNFFFFCHVAPRKSFNF